MKKNLLVARYSAFNLIGCAPDTQLETLIAFEFLTFNIGLNYKLGLRSLDVGLNYQVEVIS